MQHKYVASNKELLQVCVITYTILTEETVGVAMNVKSHPRVISHPNFGYPNPQSLWEAVNRVS